MSYLDGLSIELKTFLLVGQELLNILALISLKLNHLAHLTILDDGTIAGYGVTLAGWPDRDKNGATYQTSS